MDIGKWIQAWPVYRQITGQDPLGRGTGRPVGPLRRPSRRGTAEADHVAHSVCPYCAVGCAQNVYVKDGQVVQIEGNPDSPVSRGRLCPKGSASKQLVTGPQRERTVRYRPPYANGVAGARPRHGDGHGRRPRARRAAQGLAGARPQGQQAAPHHGDRASRRRDPGQRRELPDQEALHRAGCAADREPSPYLTLRHGSRSGSLLRSRRSDGLSARPRQLGLHHHHGLRHWPRPIRWRSSG